MKYELGARLAELEQNTRGSYRIQSLNNIELGIVDRLISRQREFSSSEYTSLMSRNRTFVCMRVSENV